jgi:hypothetical protein
MSAATGLVAARAAVDALRTSIDTAMSDPRRAHTVRVFDIFADLLDLVEDDLGLGDPGERCDICGDVVDAADFYDHRQQTHGDDV